MAPFFPDTVYVWLRGKIRVGEWYCEVVGSCKVQQGCEVRFSDNVCVCARACIEFVLSLLVVTRPWRH